MSAVNFHKTAADPTFRAYALESGKRAVKCVATMIEPSYREREILCPAHLEPIKGPETDLAETLIGLGATLLVTDALPSDEKLKELSHGCPSS
ncbi:hypothetical protein [Breoghania sp.]|uniref:hypothetical protein n=1 Tax=Breoghania sp. TaxID=2065378 RepID=UPI002AABA026|nr:hypothetical protein [Breoghania sp.]